MTATIKSTPSPAILARIQREQERKRAQALRAQARRPAEPLTHNPFAGLAWDEPGACDPPEVPAWELDRHFS